MTSRTTRKGKQQNTSQQGLGKGFECYNKGFRLHTENHISILETLWQQHEISIEKT